MYLRHFDLTEYPFTLAANKKFYCALPSHADTLEIIKTCLDIGESFVKVVAEVGSGKTMLCQLLLDALQENYLTVYIPNPHLTPDGLQHTVAKGLGLRPKADTPSHKVVQSIEKRLCKLNDEGKKVVLIVDEAQAFYTDTLESLRILTNLENDNKKLLQIVLFGQPELDEKLSRRELYQLNQRISFTHYIPRLTKQDMDVYLRFRLAQAGNLSDNLFTKRAKHLIHKSSDGLPRLINVLSHKSMLVAFSKGKKQVDGPSVVKAIRDTRSARQPYSIDKYVYSAGVAAMVVVFVWMIRLYSHGV